MKGPAAWYTVCVWMLLPLVRSAAHLDVATETVDITVLATSRPTNSASCPTSGLTFHNISSALDYVASFGFAAEKHIWLCPGNHFQPHPLVLSEAHSFLTLAPLVPQAPTIISGAAEIGNFTVQGNKWVANLEADGRFNFTQHTPQQLFVSASGGASDASRRPRARHPNLLTRETTNRLAEPEPWMHWASPLCAAKRHSQPVTPCNQWARYGMVWNETDDPVFSRLTPLDPSVDLQAVVYHGWTASRHHVRDAVISNRSLLFSNPADRFIGFFGLTNTGEGGRRFYLSNHPALLDAPGEWYLDPAKRTLSYMPRESELEALRSQRFTAFAPLQTNLITLNGTVNVTFGQGLQISFTDWSCGEHQVCDRQSTEWLQASGVRVVNASNPTFRRVELSHHGGFPLWIDAGSRDALVDSCNVTDCGAGGIRIGHSSTQRVPEDPAGRAQIAVQRARVHNTSITDGGHDFPSGTAIFSQYRVENLTITHCELSHFSYTGISLGWSWNFEVNDHQGGALVAHNYIHHLGYPRRETGDAMACIYTLNGINGAVFDSNVCHDVRAYMNGGYCLSQDQGSSNATFSNNLCFRVTGSPHNTHYGMGLRYVNNIFGYGDFENHYPDLVLQRAAPVAIRTSPSKTDCDGAAVGFPGKCPNQLAFDHNLLIQGNNSNTVLFEGSFLPNRSHGFSYNFTGNVYQSSVMDLGVPTAPASFGGCSWRMCHDPASRHRQTWTEWQRAGNDAAGVIVAPDDRLFADADWQRTLNVTLDPMSPAARSEFVSIDTSSVGLLH